MNDLWYYAENDQPVGPLSTDGLSEVLQRAFDPQKVLIWRNGFQGWIPAGAVPEIAPLLVRPPPVPKFRHFPTPPPIHNTPGEMKSRQLPGPLKQKVYPWRRYFARLFDLYVFIVLFFLFLGGLFPELFAADQGSSKREYEFLYWFVGLGAYVVFETIIVNVCGGTLGKALYSIQLRTWNGSKLSFFAALKRSLSVWVRGWAVGIPIVSLFTLSAAYRTLRAEGQSSWDRDLKLVVSHADLNAWRWLLIAVVWLLVVATYVGLIAINSR
jgi:uncharacterized RDD family membrane protein YckC